MAQKLLLILLFFLLVLFTVDKMAIYQPQNRPTSYAATYELDFITNLITIFQILTFSHH